MNPLLQLYKEQKDEFIKKFITKSAFGVSIGAIDNLNEDAESQVLNNQKSDIISIIEEIEKWADDNRPSGKAEYHNSYNDGKRDICDDLLHFLKEAKQEINKE